MNSACTFGAWHPLAAEKLMTYDMNTASDFSTFQNGVMRIRKPKNNNGCNWMQLCELQQLNVRIANVLKLFNKEKKMTWSTKSVTNFDK